MEERKLMAQIISVSVSEIFALITCFPMVFGLFLFDILSCDVTQIHVYVTNQMAN